MSGIPLSWPCCFFRSQVMYFWSNLTEIDIWLSSAKVCKRLFMKTAFSHPLFELAFGHPLRACPEPIKGGEIPVLLIHCYPLPPRIKIVVISIMSAGGFTATLEGRRMHKESPRKLQYWLVSYLERGWGEGIIFA